MSDIRKSVDAVQVALRVRPLTKEEIDRNCRECVEVVPGEPQVQIKDLRFNYNYVFPKHIKQQEFYDNAVKGHIEKLFQGYNVTILAYGQTGSGKTYTMGTNFSASDSDSTQQGVIPQSVKDIFRHNDANNSNSKVSVSFLELYQDRCYDLLSGKDRAESIIKIREDVNKGVILPGITEQLVGSVAQTMQALEQGSARRMTGATAMNQHSNRSHTIFTMVITTDCGTDRTVTSKLHLVDLAGSERLKKTIATGNRLKEGVKINQSLFALGNVISALGDATNRSFINYRSSNLTRLLQDSLSGDSLLLMVACVSPADFNLDESLSTLRYADRARRIRSAPAASPHASAANAEILRLKALVAELRMQSQGDKEALSEERATNAALQQKQEVMRNHLKQTLVENLDLQEQALVAQKTKAIISREFNEVMARLQHREGESSKRSDSRGITWLAAPQTLDDPVQAAQKMKPLIGQEALDAELQELDRAMALKSSAVQSILASNDMLNSQGNQHESEQKISELQKERDELMQQLKQTKVKASQDERCTKVSHLEQQIQELKRKCQQQSNTIKMKDKNEAKITVLNTEIQAMKTAKAQLTMQKRDNDRAMVRLKDEERKRAAHMAQMQTLHAKQQNVLKRKMEEVVAVNKRLKDVLEKLQPQPVNTVARNAHVNAKGVENICDKNLGIADAEIKLEELLEYRTAIIDRVKKLRSSLTQDEARRGLVTELERDLVLKNEQRAGLQQDLAAAADKHKKVTQWDNLKSLAEAKKALYYIFEILVDAKRELQSVGRKNERLQQAHDRLAAQFKSSESECMPSSSGVPPPVTSSTSCSTHSCSMDSNPEAEAGTNLQEKPT